MDYNSLESEDRPIVSAYRYMFSPTGTARLVLFASLVIPGFKFLPIPAQRKLKEARKKLDETALNLIHLKQERERSGDKDGRGDRDILGVMIEKNRESRETGRPEDALSETEMLNQISTFLVAGFVP